MKPAVSAKELMKYTISDRRRSTNAVRWDVTAKVVETRPRNGDDWDKVKAW
jgi:hypothetical protein